MTTSEGTSHTLRDSKHHPGPHVSEDFNGEGTPFSPCASVQNCNVSARVQSLLLCLWKVIIGDIYKCIVTLNSQKQHLGRWVDLRNDSSVSTFISLFQITHTDGLSTNYQYGDCQ